MAPLSNETVQISYSLPWDECFYYDFFYDLKNSCYIPFFPSPSVSVNDYWSKMRKCMKRCINVMQQHQYYQNKYSQDFYQRMYLNDQAMPTQIPQTYPKVLPNKAGNKATGSDTDELLRAIAFKALLPIVLVMVVICIVLGVILIIRSYKMKPLKQNLALAIKRRRSNGKAPDNPYVPAEEVRASVRASQHWGNAISNDNGENRKSLPPPEVLRAARERASQIFTA